MTPIRHLALLLLLFAAVPGCGGGGPADLSKRWNMLHGAIYMGAAGASGALQVGDGHAYIYDGDGLEVIDIHDPLHPTRIGGLPALAAKGNAISLLLDGTTLYYEDSAADFNVVDVSVPANPVIRGTVHGSCAPAAKVGTIVYCASGVRAMTSIDVSDPTAPMLTSYDYRSSFGRAMSWDGRYLFVNGTTASEFDSADGHIDVWDVSAPAQPHIVQQLRHIHGLSSVTAANGWLVVDSGAGLFAIDFHDVTTPVPDTNFPFGRSTEFPEHFLYKGLAVEWVGALINVYDASALPKITLGSSSQAAGVGIYAVAMDDNGIYSVLDGGFHTFVPR